MLLSIPPACTLLPGWCFSQFRHFRLPLRCLLAGGFHASFHSACLHASARLALFSIQAFPPVSALLPGWRFSQLRQFRLPLRCLLAGGFHASFHSACLHASARLVFFSIQAIPPACTVLLSWYFSHSK
ncbi:MAG: hypothetical protein IJI10_09470 [Eubacterium sp.]|nr:hypothetical protein [Eubacterium sp.]